MEADTSLKSFQNQRSSELHCAKHKQMKKKKVQNNIKLDAYHNLICYISDAHIPYKSKDSSEQCKMILNETVFACFCKKYYKGRRKLILHGNNLYFSLRQRLKDEDIPKLLNFLKHNQDVISLNLAYNEITSVGFKILINYMTEYANNVCELNIQNNSICKNGIDYMYDVGENLKLTSLRLNGNNFGIESSKKVALWLLKNSNIKHLDVAEVNQSTSSLVYFISVLRSDQVSYNKSLKILDISRGNLRCISHFDTSHFATIIGLMLRHNECLAELHLQKYNFDCHDIESMIENAKYNNTLHLLDLGSNNIGDHGIKCIARWLETRPALRGLILSRNIITDHGVRNLSMIIPYSKLILLDISYNKATDNGVISVLNSLKKSPPLRHLRIFGNRIGHASAKVVERMLISEVLIQENLDVTPYKVDRIWNIAQYPADRYKQKYYEISDYGVPQLLTISYKSNTGGSPALEKCLCSICDPDEVRKYDVPNVVNSSELSRMHRSTECACCYCHTCESKTAFSQLGKHPYRCSCCECKVDKSSSGESEETKPEKLDSRMMDDEKKLLTVLKHVNPEVQQKILRWININEKIFNEDLKAAEILGQKNSTESVNENEITCDCWISYITTILHSVQTSEPSSSKEV